MMITSDIFAVPVKDNILLYSPLHGLTALINYGAAIELRNCLSRNQEVHPDHKIKQIADQLNEPPIVLKQKNGLVNSPLFLGLVTTRNCNMGCLYCDFAAPKAESPIMDLNTAKASVDAYLKILISGGQVDAHIHFFGGEPFYAKDVIDFVIGYATQKTQDFGMAVHFEVITNGLFSSDRAWWIGSYFDTVVLSLDGPSNIQDRNRPSIGGKGLSDIVCRSAKILSESNTNLIIRSCITDDTVERMPDLAEWIATEFRPSAWCVEPLTVDSPLPNENISTPNPWKFAVNFDRSAQILDQYGIRLVNSTVELGNPSLSCCPVGQDALIISPDGHVDSCYLLEKDWTSREMNMRMGLVKDGSQTGFEFDAEAVQRVREMNVNSRNLCRDCMCRYSCAGGCYVNHNTDREPGDFDNICVYTRLITITKLLRTMNQNELADEWLANEHDTNRSVWRKDDRLFAEDLGI